MRVCRYQVDRICTFSPELQTQLGSEAHGFNTCGEVTGGKHVNHRIHYRGTNCAGIKASNACDCCG